MASGCPLRIERHHAQPNRWTFTIPPIAALIAEEGVGEGWVDPFAGMHSPAGATNDINEAMPARHHLDALHYLGRLPDEAFIGAIYDPPYSLRQAAEMYEGHGKVENWIAYFAACRDEVARVVRPGGRAICCGWTSVGLGRQRGFRTDRVLLVPHGSSRNDTIVTVETKIQGRLL